MVYVDIWEGVLIVFSGFVRLKWNLIFVSFKILMYMFIGGKNGYICNDYRRVVGGVRINFV